MPYNKGNRKNKVVKEAPPQWTYTNNTITLRVKKAHIIGRAFLFFMAFGMLLVPVIAFFNALSAANGMLFLAMIVIAVFGYIGHRTLRLALWNTRGLEVITYKGNQIEYMADYGWFKDKIKSISANDVHYDISPIGYEDEGLGVLILKSMEDTINSAVKIPIDDLEKLIGEVEAQRN